MAGIASPLAVGPVSGTANPMGAPASSGADAAIASPDRSKP